MTSGLIDSARPCAAMRCHRSTAMDSGMLLSAEPTDAKSPAVPLAIAQSAALPKSVCSSWSVQGGAGDK